MFTRSSGRQDWPKATAVVTSSEILCAIRVGTWNRIDFSYTTPDGAPHNSSLDADSTTALFKLAQRDTFAIRYNPANPGDSYSVANASASSSTRGANKAMLAGIAMFGLLVLLYQWWR